MHDQQQQKPARGPQVLPFTLVDRAHSPSPPLLRRITDFQALLITDFQALLLCLSIVFHQFVGIW